MALFCKHRWREVERFSAPPFGGKLTSLMDDDILREMVFGVTVIVQQCEHCGRLTQTRVLGRKMDNETP
jgi:hypothetical protein